METDARQTTSQKVQPLNFRLALGWIIPWSSRTGLRQGTLSMGVSEVGQDLQHVNLWAITPPTGLEAIEPNGPPESPANAQATAGSDEGAPPIDQIGVTAPAASFAWDREINIGDRDRIALSIAPPSGIKRRHLAIITGALLLALGLGLGLGWIGGSNSDFPSVNPASLPLKQLNSSACTTDPRNETVCVTPKSDRPEMPSSLTSVTQTTTGIDRAPETSKGGSQTTNAVSLPTKQNKIAPGPAAIDRAKVSSRPVPVPETRPTTIEGWTVREVNGGMAVLVGPNGTWKAARGDMVPGVGKVDSIVRWGNHWIVATSRGLISTR